MKFSLIFLSLLITACSFPEQNYCSIMSYNLRYDTDIDAENRWELRKDRIVEQIRFYEPDILGIQEGLYSQVSFLDRSLEQYSYRGVGRDDGDTKGEYSAIFFRTDRYDVLADGTFWLSESPDTVSVGWDASMERICTWARFRDKLYGLHFWVFNTHFDHIGTEARKQSAQLILNKIAELNRKNDPVVLTGDLNLTPDSEPIRMISSSLNDSYLHADVKIGPEGTYNGFRTDELAGRRIDYVFFSEQFDIIKYAALSDIGDLRYPSDHFPVYTLAHIELSD